jgi:hypothetical protein
VPLPPIVPPPPPEGHVVMHDAPMQNCGAVMLLPEPLTVKLPVFVCAVELILSGASQPGLPEVQVGGPFRGAVHAARAMDAPSAKALSTMPYAHIFISSRNLITMLIVRERRTVQEKLFPTSVGAHVQKS